MLRDRLLGIVLALSAGCSTPVAPAIPGRTDDSPVITPVESFHEDGPRETTCILAPSDPSLRPYVGMLRDNDLLVSAIKFCDLPRQIHDMMWTKLTEAEATGNSPTVSFSHPRSDVGGASIDYEEEEAFEIVAARLAHALWLDHHQMVPWRLSDYNQQELVALLDPQQAFMVWDTRTSYYHDSGVINHDPAIAYHLALEAVGGRAADQESQKSALTALVDSTRSFRHGIVGRHELFIRTLEEMHDEQVSMYGCASMAYYLIALARALNIPGRPLQGYYSAPENHTSAVFDMPGLVLAHGDDIYQAYLRSTPSEELLDSLVFWHENVLIHPPGDGRVYHATNQHNYENAMRYPTWFLAYWYCERGRPFLDATFRGFATPEQISELEGRLLTMSEGCRRFGF